MSKLTDYVRGNREIERPGLLFEDISYSHAEIFRQASARARFIEDLDLGEPKHVGVLLENVPEAIFWMQGAFLVGATVVGLNSTRSPAELVRDATHTDCRLIVTDGEGRKTLAGAGLTLPAVAIDDPDYETRLQGFAGMGAPEVDVPDDARAILIFTSGTTSAPKAAMRTHGALVAISLGVTAAWSITPEDVAYNAMPWFHSNALYHAILPVIVTSGTLAMRRRFSASGFIGDVKKFRATRFNYVGKVLEYILATPEDPADAENDLRIVTGSEASERDIAEFSRRFDVYVMDGFGSTEGGVGILRTADTPPGSLGLPADENTVVMDRATMQECPRAKLDEHGRLLNSGECIGEFVNKNGLSAFEGYYKNDEANEERALNGWFWSGDLGYRDDAGFFYFAGRGYDLLRVDGENFSAAPIERIVMRYEPVLLVAVYAVPDPNTGDQVMVALQLRPGSRFDADEFAAFLDGQSDLSEKWWPRFVRVADQLPYGHTNKIKKVQLRQEAWEVADPVWWRPAKEHRLQPLSDGDREDLRRSFQDSGRANLLPDPAR